MEKMLWKMHVACEMNECEMILRSRLWMCILQMHINWMNEAISRFVCTVQRPLWTMLVIFTRSHTDFFFDSRCYSALLELIWNSINIFRWHVTHKRIEYVTKLHIVFHFEVKRNETYNSTKCHKTRISVRNH